MGGGRRGQGGRQYRRRVCERRERRIARGLRPIASSGEEMMLIGLTEADFDVIDMLDYESAEWCN